MVLRVRRAAPWKDLPRRVFDATLICFPGAIPLAIFLLFAPNWLEQGDRDIDRPTWRSIVGGYSGGTIPDRGMYSVLLPEGEERPVRGGWVNWMRRWYMSRG